MSMQEPGLDLHEWETRWAEIEEALTDDPGGGLVAACDEIEELLQAGQGDAVLGQQQPELERAFASARDVADRYERGDDVPPGDIGGAVETLRTIRAALVNPGDE